MSVRLCVGDCVLIKTSVDDDIDKIKQGMGLIKYIGFIQGQKHPMRQYVGVELLESIENGHNGTIDGYQYFTSPNGHGIHVELRNIIRKLSIAEIMDKLKDVLTFFKSKIAQYTKALNERDEYIEKLKSTQKHLKSLLNQSNTNITSPVHPTDNKQFNHIYIHNIYTPNQPILNKKLIKTTNSNTISTIKPSQILTPLTPMTPSSVISVASMDTMILKKSNSTKISFDNNQHSAKSNATTSTSDFLTPTNGKDSNSNSYPSTTATTSGATATATATATTTATTTATYTNNTTNSNRKRLPIISDVNEIENNKKNKAIYPTISNQHEIYGDYPCHSFYNGSTPNFNIHTNPIHIQQRLQTTGYNMISLQQPPNIQIQNSHYPPLPILIPIQSVPITPMHHDQSMPSHSKKVTFNHTTKRKKKSHGHLNKKQEKKKWKTECIHSPSIHSKTQSISTAWTESTYCTDDDTLKNAGFVISAQYIYDDDDL